MELQPKDKTVNITFRLNEKLVKDFMECCKQIKISTNEGVKQLIKQFLTQHGK